MARLLGALLFLCAPCVRAASPVVSLRATAFPVLPAVPLLTVRPAPLLLPLSASPVLPAPLPGSAAFRAPAPEFLRPAGARATPARSEAARPYGFLHATMRAHSARLSEIVATAARTPTGAQVLERAAVLLARRGREVPVSFMGLGGNLGEFDYIDGSLRLSRRYLDGAPEEAAATLVHELVHVCQEYEGAPADALEREIEAHMVGRTFLRELGVEPTDSFSKALERELRKGAEAAAEWLAGQLPGTIRIEGRPWKDVLDDLDTAVEDLEEREGRSQRAARQLERARAELKRARTARGKAAALELSRRAWALLRAASAKSS